MRKPVKMSVPGANNWIEEILIPQDNPHKLLVIVKAGPNQMSHRQLRAKLFKLAAEFELRTPEAFKWIINVDGIAHYGQGRKAMSIHIELGEDSMDEFYVAEGLVQDIALELERHTLLI